MSEKLLMPFGKYRIKKYPAIIAIYRDRRWIKINGEWIRYARYIFEKEVRPLRPSEIVHHKDEDKLNDDPYNLEAMTRSKHNVIHKKGKQLSDKHKKNISIGRAGMKFSNDHRKSISISTTGNNNANAKLTFRNVEEIRHRYWWIKHITQHQLAHLYNVTRSCIDSILQGYSWNPNNLTKQELKDKSKILRIPI